MHKSVNSSGNERRNIVVGNGSGKTEREAESAANKKNDVNGKWKDAAGLKKRVSKKCGKNFVENVKKSKGKKQN